jgi:drug/metabolite transporter (DMT)-like permease
MKEIFLILLVSLNTIASQLVLKNGLQRLEPPGGGLSGVVMFVARGAVSPYVIAAVGLQVLGYLLWWFVVIRVKLGLAFAISGSMFYLLMAAASWWVFGETLTALQWLGLVLVTIGVLCLTSGGSL